MNNFAQATDDHQWIHVDPERAASGPFGGTIAHGLLTLSLLPKFMHELYRVDNIAMAINYGFNKVRFITPVPVGAKVRASSVITGVDKLDGAVQAWIAERDLDDVVEAFEEAGAALFPVYDVAQLFADPQVQARDAVTTVDDEDLGPLRMQNVWFRLSRTPGAVRFAGRRLGQDTDAVLLGLGYTPEQVAELRKDGVV